MLRINNYKTINEIYTNYNFNPVSHNILNLRNFKLLEKQRISLFEDFLKLPREIFKNKKIIEFGSASGEKSLFYCLWGG